MNYGKLLLKSIKLILPTTIGCIIGMILIYILSPGFNRMTNEHITTYIIGFIFSFTILTGITWAFYILKFHKK